MLNSKTFVCAILTAKQPNGYIQLGPVIAPVVGWAKPNPTTKIATT
jgi:hypothetical protein